MKQKFTVFDAIIYLLFILIMIACIYPFYYVVIYSISNPELASKVVLLPKGFSLQTYKTLFSLNNIVGAFGISVARTVLGTGLTVVCTSFLAYLVTKQEMFARKFVYRFFVITMYINAGLIPWYLTMRAYGLKDNFLLYILPTAVSAYYMILIKTYMESLPISMEESARIDGAGYFRIFRSINDENLQTMQMILYNYINQAQNVANVSSQTMADTANAVKITPMAIKMCITVIATVPIMCVYPFLQKHFVKGIMMGAVKG